MENNGKIFNKVAAKVAEGINSLRSFQVGKIEKSLEDQRSTLEDIAAVFSTFTKAEKADFESAYASLMTEYVAARDLAINQLTAEAAYEGNGEFDLINSATLGEAFGQLKDHNFNMNAVYHETGHSNYSKYSDLIDSVGDTTPVISEDSLTSLTAFNGNVAEYEDNMANYAKCTAARDSFAIKIAGDLAGYEEEIKGCKGKIEDSKALLDKLGDAPDGDMTWPEYEKMVGEAKTEIATQEIKLNSFEMRKAQREQEGVEGDAAYASRLDGINATIQFLAAHSAEIKASCEALKTQLNDKDGEIQEDIIKLEASKDETKGKIDAIDTPDYQAEVARLEKAMEEAKEEASKLMDEDPNSDQLDDKLNAAAAATQAWWNYTSIPEDNLGELKVNLAKTEFSLKDAKTAKAACEDGVSKISEVIEGMSFEFTGPADPIGGIPVA